MSPLVSIVSVPVHMLLILWLIYAILKKCDILMSYENAEYQSFHQISAVMAHSTLWIYMD